MSAASGISGIVIVGAGGHASVVADIVLCAARAGEPLRLVGFVDEDPSKHGTEVLGHPVLGDTAALGRHDFDAFVVGIGDNRVRAQTAEALIAGGLTPSAPLIHPSAVIAADVVIGVGTMICAGVVINPGAVIGEHVIVNTGATIDHHGDIGPFAHVAPGAHLGGNVRVGRGALVGIGSAVKPGCSVGEWAVVGAGAAVVGTIDAHSTALGVPARALPSQPEGG